MINKILKTALIAGLAFGLGNTAYAAQAVSLDELLQQVKTGRVKDAEENKKRIAEFQRARGQQQQLLRNMEAEQVRQEQLSVQLEDTFEANDAQIIDLERALQERLGELKELFGVLQQAAGDARGRAPGTAACPPPRPAGSARGRWPPPPAPLSTDRCGRWCSS